MPKDMTKDEKGRLLRGLSRNTICIMTLTDGNTAIMIAEGFGKPSKEALRRALEPHIIKGSHMIDDGEKSHSVLAKDMNLTREIHKTSETK